MTRLRSVKKGETPPPSRLVATQITTIPTGDGQFGVVMLDTQGVVYAYTPTGWLPFNMVEVPNDPPV